MEKFITISESHFDSIQAKADKYDRGEMNDSMFIHYKQLCSMHDSSFDNKLQKIVKIDLIRREFDDIINQLKSKRVSFDLALLKSSVFMLIFDDYPEHLGFDYRKTDELKAEIIKAKEYIESKIFMSTKNKNRLSSLLDIAYYLSIGNNNDKL